MIPFDLRAKWVHLACALVAAAVAQAQPTEVVLHNFEAPPNGSSPLAPVTRDVAGNLYGTTAYGGAHGLGVIYKLDPAGQETVLHSFTGGADGANPGAGLIRDALGNLYGSASSGGASGAGVVFKLDIFGRETVLYNFTGGLDGASPNSSLVRDAAGNLYGTNGGIIFKIDATGHETTVYTFDTGTYYEISAGGLILDSSDNLYGTALGGPLGSGFVFQVDPAGHETILYSFTGGADGSSPAPNLIRDAAGNFYGTTGLGGASLLGTVFKLDATGHETVLYSFTGGADGGLPWYGVVQDAAGNLYGIATTGGSLLTNAGVVFKVDATGSETVLYTFASTSVPNPVILDAGGNLYGTTEVGGPSSTGTIYKVDPAGNETLLYAFPTTADGYNPRSGLIRDGAGNLYGTTSTGGAGGAGTVFMVNALGIEKILYSFTGGADGARPLAGVIRDSAGNLYGTTFRGGTSNWGVVFKVDAEGIETVLHSFTNVSDGASPSGGLLLDASGNLYGTTQVGGTGGVGVVFRVDPTGHETLLHNFGMGSDASGPHGGLISDLAGNLYGTTAFGGALNLGTIFKLDPAGNVTLLHSFDFKDGSAPSGNLIRDAAGNFYGTTYSGGASKVGTVFKMDLLGRVTVIHSFSGADGMNPNTAVVRDSAGYVYGTTPSGGAAGFGVVYRVDVAGSETVLYSFTGGADGGVPLGGLVVDSAGNLYGTASLGGKSLGGLVFKLRR